MIQNLVITLSCKQCIPYSIGFLRLLQYFDSIGANLIYDSVIQIGYLVFSLRLGLYCLE